MSSAVRRGLTYDEVRSKLFTLIVKNARVLREELADDKSLREDLHLDSLDFIGVVSAVEGEFAIVIPDEDAERLKTVADVCDTLWEKLA
jgi:acyl carrier protein